MFLTVFIVVQAVIDVFLVAVVVVMALQRRAAPAPPDWYPQLVEVAQDLLAVAEPVLDAVEGGAADDAPAAEAGRRRRAAMQLRTGLAPDEVARRNRLLPGELRLISGVVAAEAATRSSSAK